jgi:hypothetical protein
MLGEECSGLLLTAVLSCHAADSALQTPGGMDKFRPAPVYPVPLLRAWQEELSTRFMEWR